MTTTTYTPNTRDAKGCKPDLNTPTHPDDMAAIIEQHREFMKLTDDDWMDSAPALQDRAYALGRARGKAEQTMRAEQHQGEPSEVIREAEETIESAWAETASVRIKVAELTSERDALRAQLAERDALLRDCFTAMLKGGYSKPLRERIKAALGCKP